MEKTAKVDK